MLECLPLIVVLSSQHLSSPLDASRFIGRVQVYMIYLETLIHEHGVWLINQATAVKTCLKNPTKLCPSPWLASHFGTKQVLGNSHAWFPPAHAGSTWKTQSSNSNNATIGPKPLQCSLVRTSPAPATFRPTCFCGNCFLLPFVWHIGTHASLAPPDEHPPRFKSIKQASAAIWRTTGLFENAISSTEGKDQPRHL